MAKNSKKEIEKIDRCISDLVYDKQQLKKAYNYYHSIRDPEQFRYLEENYGIGTPTSVSFTPLVKKHIDVLVGEYLTLDPEVQVTCKDDATISNIMRDKKLKIDKELFDYLQKYLKNSIVNIISGAQEPKNDPFVEKELQKIKQSIEENYVSEYETAAQNMLKFFRTSRDFDLKNKMSILYTDLLVGGLCYYRTKPTSDGKNIKFEILNPIDTFVERNRNEFYLNKSPRCVVRRYLTETQILLEFGAELTQDAKKKLLDNKGERRYENSDSIYVHAGYREVPVEDPELYGELKPTPGVLGGLEVCPLFPFGSEHAVVDFNTIPVYEVEWVEYNSDEDCLVKHEGVKIGDDIYITRGEAKNQGRSMSDPKNCTLSVNGIFFSDRNGNPFSMILNTMHLQDKLDLLIYYRDNLIASSGTVGDWIDLAVVPNALGVDFPERLAKWLAYKKNGIGLIDSSQEGAQMLNTTFNGFDDTVKAQSIQAIQFAIESIENEVSSMTGVFKQQLGQIETREAASNVKYGARQSTVLTKQYFNAMDLIFKEVNYDFLNLAKVVYKDGFTGAIVLGEKLSKIFTALPEHYTVTDFDVHIQDSSEVYKNKESVQLLNMEFVKGGLVDAGIAVDVATAQNMTDLKRYIKNGLAAKKAENDMIGQLQQQLQQAQEQAKQMEKQLSDLTNQNKQLNQQLQQNNQAKIELEKERIKLERLDIENKDSYNDKLVELKKKQIELEKAQMFDGNPYNDKILDI